MQCQPAFDIMVSDAMQIADDYECFIGQNYLLFV